MQTNYHYSVFMVYGKYPTQAIPVFTGRAWRLAASCLRMNRSSGDRIFYVKEFDDIWTSEEAIDWGRRTRSWNAPLGYRCATHEEGFVFQKACPEFEQMVALGSYTLHAGARYAFRAEIDVQGNRVLRGAWYESSWEKKNLCLFVVQKFPM